MKNILILGANGKIARIVEKILLNNMDYKLTLILRNSQRLNKLHDARNVNIIEGSVSDKELLKEVLVGQDIVYANLNGNMEQWAHNIVDAMSDSSTNKLIWITGSGLYHEVPDPFGSWVENYVGHESKEDTRKAAKIIENSQLQYSIIRAAYMTNDDEVDYELTKKGETFKGTMISRSSIADFVIKIIDKPDKYSKESFGISKPGTDNMLNKIREIEHDL
ncbi:NAD(P)H-binding protein [Companilactobacillus kimchiensis]|uniref:NAD-dependent epimerase dehydratase n=1 Tax=Companilactobacillus kimchiensis TaxID=993692 RepID=A0A0R2LL56_9LACO|nr:NAD(P)H-binding protein [Companilactobacillus kimchiensis]KRO00603.1 NAD-dependent epimerase dehydratase [Companilactobacillus kimchiensis]